MKWFVLPFRKLRQGADLQRRPHSLRSTNPSIARYPRKPARHFLHRDSSNQSVLPPSLFPDGQNESQGILRCDRRHGRAREQNHFLRRLASRSRHRLRFRPRCQAISDSFAALRGFRQRKRRRFDSGFTDRLNAFTAIFSKRILPRPNSKTCNAFWSILPAAAAE